MWQETLVVSYTTGCVFFTLFTWLLLIVPYSTGCVFFTLFTWLLSIVPYSTGCVFCTLSTWLLLTKTCHSSYVHCSFINICIYAIFTQIAWLTVVVTSLGLRARTLDKWEVMVIDCQLPVLVYVHSGQVENTPKKMCGQLFWYWIPCDMEINLFK
jgi:hypothetical protein